jgi:hypothetical protein
MLIKAAANPDYCYRPKTELLEVVPAQNKPWFLQAPPTFGAGRKRLSA